MDTCTEAYKSGGGLVAVFDKEIERVNIVPETKQCHRGEKQYPLIDVVSEHTPYGRIPLFMLINGPYLPPHNRSRPAAQHFFADRSLSAIKAVSGFAGRVGAELAILNKIAVIGHMPGSKQDFCFVIEPPRDRKSYAVVIMKRELLTVLCKAILVIAEQEIKWMERAFLYLHASPSIACPLRKGDIRKTNEKE